MGSLARKAIGGSIHKIREFELEKVSLAEEFDILQIVGEGWFGKILLVEHKHTDTEMVLKALPKPYTALRDFYREFHYGLHLGAHKNVITTYDVAFETAGFYVFSQEYAPLGDLTSNVSETGIGELHTKRVARQLAAALEHLHGRDLVHRDVKLDNILVFKSDFSRVKLCDFGETRRVGSVVRRHNEWLPYAPPEVLTTANDDMYKAVTSHDVWQFAIVVFVCLTGCLPWQKAANDDPRYTRYVSWHSSSIPIRRVPKLFKLVSSKAQRLFRKCLEPNCDKRPPTLTDVHRFLEDRWLAKNSSEKNNGLSTEDDGLCPSMYSYHSSPEEKNKLLHSLTQYGIETTVDRGAKKDRIRAWIETSVIEEEDEEEAEEDTDAEEERVGIMDNEAGPMGERMNRGPIEDKRQQFVKDNARLGKQKRRERRLSAISRRTSAVYTLPIDPRLPLESQRFSQSEMNLNRNFIFPSEGHVDMDAITQDDVTISYARRAESHPNIKDMEIRHAVPLNNLVAINGHNDKDTSPPKNNSLSIINKDTSPPKNNILPIINKDTSPPKNSSLPTINKDTSPPKNNVLPMINKDSSFPKINDTRPQVYSKQNGHSQTANTHQIKQPPTVVENYQQQRRNSNNQIKQQSQQQTQRPPQPIIRNDLVENRNRHIMVNGQVRSPPYKKKPMKERFEAYGGYEEKSNTSSSTARSISK